MADLEPYELARCAQCRRLFRCEQGRNTCRACAGLALPASDAPAASSPFPGSLPEADTLSGDARGGAVCIACRQRPTLANRKHCLECSFDLVNGLGTAASALLSEAQALSARSRLAAANPLQHLDEKRLRAPSNRIRLVVAPRLR